MTRFARDVQVVRPRHTASPARPGEIHLRARGGFSTLCDRPCQHWTVRWDGDVLLTSAQMCPTCATALRSGAARQSAPRPGARTGLSTCSSRR